MRRWSYTLLTALLTIGALVLEHAPASGAGAAPLAAQAAPQSAPEEFVPTEKLPADASISFPVDI